MTDALVLCVRCMRFACETPGKCGEPTLSAPTGDASEALWMSFCEIFDLPRPAGPEQGALITPPRRPEP